jgi:hypothetical protein
MENNNVETVLWARKIGAEDWQEEIISTNPTVFEAARKWAVENGFDRFRISELDLNEMPDFSKTVKI